MANSNWHLAKPTPGDHLWVSSELPKWALAELNCYLLIAANCHLLLLPFPLSQPPALQFSRRRTRQFGYELNRARILVRCNLILRVVLQLAPQRVGSFRLWGQHHKGLDDLATVAMGGTNHRAFGYFRMA